MQASQHDDHHGMPDSYRGRDSSEGKGGCSLNMEVCNKAAGFSSRALPALALVGSALCF